MGGWGIQLHRLLTCMHCIGLRIDQLHFGSLGQWLITCTQLTAQLQLGVFFFLLLLLLLPPLRRQLLLLLFGIGFLLDLWLIQCGHIVVQLACSCLQIAANVRYSLLLCAGTVCRRAQRITVRCLGCGIVVLCKRGGERG